MATPELDPDSQVKGTAFTKKAYRDVYPAVDPSIPSMSQAGKVIIITGASRGLGQLVSIYLKNMLHNMTLIHD